MKFCDLGRLLLLCATRSCARAAQVVLGPVNGPHAIAEADGENWSVREQHDSVCAAGSRHFAGRVNVTNEKSLFFWFFESRKSPNQSPVVIWLNGGPGASSLAGLYGEVGPCTINKDGNGTTYSSDSWTENANILFIDQPAGVGLSTITKISDYPHNLESSAPDFIALLRVFYSEIFPQHKRNELYIAGESFGGRYAPYYAATILREQLDNAAGALQDVRLRGIVLVNAMVGSSWSSLGHYDLFCTNLPPNVLRFNETVCRAMASAVPECERLQAICTSTRNSHVCEAAFTFCAENLEKPFQEEVDNHRRSTYDLRKDCPDPPLCGVGNSSFGSTSDFLNRVDVQRQLGFKSQVEYKSINFDLNTQWALDPRIYVPTTSELTYLLNGGVIVPGENTDVERVVSVFIINGEYDAACNLPGAIREYDNLPWHRQAAYRAVKEFEPWYWADKDGKSQVGGLWKGTPQQERGLEFVSVKDAGHMAPGDQRGAVASVFARWITNGGRLGVGSLKV